MEATWFGCALAICGVGGAFVVTVQLLLLRFHDQVISDVAIALENLKEPDGECHTETRNDLLSTNWPEIRAAVAKHLGISEDYLHEGTQLGGLFVAESASPVLSRLRRWVLEDFLADVALDLGKEIPPQGMDELIDKDGCRLITFALILSEGNRKS